MSPGADLGGERRMFKLVAPTSVPYHHLWSVMLLEKPLRLAGSRSPKVPASEGSPGSLRFHSTLVLATCILPQ